MIRLFKHYISYNVLMLALVDLVLLVAAAEAAWLVRVNQIATGQIPLVERIHSIAAFAAIMWLAMIAVGSYRPEALRSVRVAMSRTMVAFGLGVIAISFVNLLIPGAMLWRSVLLYAVVIVFGMLGVNRLLMGKLLGSDPFRRRILVLGAGPRAARLQQLAKRSNSGFEVAAFVAMGSGDPMIAEAVPRASIADLGQFVERIRADEVVLALQERRNSLPLKDLLRVKTKGVLVSDFSSLLERETGRVDLDSLNPSWLIFSDGFSSGRRLSSIAKRIFDVTVSLALLIVGLPLILVFAVLVKLESKGPAFYRQVRVGLFGEPFSILKLRSMREDAEVAGAKWAEKDDPRITRVGRFIRLVRIDELPQLWSVLKGEMSFVGPRPERPQFVEDLERELPFYAERHMVKPGITGWAQINYPYGASTEDARQKLEYDLYYAKNYTPFLDVLILLQTARVILWPEGVR